MAIKSIYSSFSTLYKFGKILGLLTYSFDSKKSEFTVQKKDIFTTAIIILSFVLIQFYIFEKCQSEINDTESILYFILNIDTCILTFFSSISFYLYKFKLIEIFKKIHLLDTQLKYESIKNKRFQKYLNLSVINVIIYFSINIGGYLFLYSEETDFICTSGVFLSYFIIVCLRLIFVFFLTEIECRLTYIRSIQDQYTTLCKKSFTKLFHILGIINIVHNVNLLLNFLKLFIQILFTLAYMLSLFTDSDEFNSIQYILIYYSTSFIWISLSIFDLISIVYYVEKVYLKVKLY